MSFSSLLAIIFASLGPHAFGSPSADPLRRLDDAHFDCSLPDMAGADELWEIANRSCGKVRLASTELLGIVSQTTVAQTYWKEEIGRATKQCREAEASDDPSQAAELALEAWGSYLMKDRQCCNLLTPPYCHPLSYSKVWHIMPLIVALLGLIGVRVAPWVSGKFTAPPLMSSRQGPQPAPVIAAKLEVSARARADTADKFLQSAGGDSDTGAASSGGSTQLKRELQNVFCLPPGATAPEWSSAKLGSPLRALPLASEWADIASSVFAEIGTLFSFQGDNIRNQFEHLLSLWRSEVAMVADEDSQTPELRYLDLALSRMHEELLEGFQLWRSKQSNRESGSGGSDSGMPALAGLQLTLPTRLQHMQGQPLDASKVIRQLEEIAVWLLVWGEAGNLRFMPEMLYFIADAILTFRIPPGSDSIYDEPAEEGMNNLFLTRVVRPIYNCVFDTNYDKVGIDVDEWELLSSTPSERLITGSVKERQRATSQFTPVVGMQARHSEQEKVERRQLWTLEHVRFHRNGTDSLVRIRWCCDKSYCIAVREDAGVQTPHHATVHLVQVSEGRKWSDRAEASQLFRVDREAGRIYWSGGDSMHCLTSCMGHNMALKPMNEADRPAQTFAINLASKKSKKDTKELRQGFENFMPPDMPNYDDWNEVFNDEATLKEKLVMANGHKLYELPLSSRFAALAYVDWHGSLSNLKTHREVHSWWGVFASIHRVIFLHALAFILIVTAVCTEEYSTSASAEWKTLAGSTRGTCFAAALLIVPIHALCLNFAFWATAGSTTRWNTCRLTVSLLIDAAKNALWFVCVGTYVFVRYVDAHQQQSGKISLKYALTADYVVNGVGAVVLLCFPGKQRDNLFSLSHVSYVHRIGRWLFWSITFGLKSLLGWSVARTLYKTSNGLMLANPLDMSADGVFFLFLNPLGCCNMLMWLLLWSVGFMLFITDTQLWFVATCTFLGAAIGFAQRSWRFCSFICEDAVACIPERLREKVFMFATDDSRVNRVWDRIVDFMRYEDKLDTHDAAQMTYSGQVLDRGGVTYNRLCAQLAARSGPEARPRILVPTQFVERWLRRETGLLPDPNWPQNAEVQWRLAALSRSLTLQLPKPFRVPCVPGLTVLIPHYGEAIIVTKDDLLKTSKSNVEEVPLMTWLKHRYPGEFEAFTDRMAQRHPDWPRHDLYAHYQEEHWDKICMWGSMRNQTLWRTVAGLTLYHQALAVHDRVQGNRDSSLRSVWDPADCFTCMVSMQMYKFFNNLQLKHTQKLLKKFRQCLRVAYIDYEEKQPRADIRDNVHVSQQRTYYSCLIDDRCPCVDEKGLPDKDGLRRKPKLRIELPGFPILGDGKGDNQNHAIPFSRGGFIQCIDANQGAYFEQMLLLPCVFGEFRSGDHPSTNACQCSRVGGQAAGGKKIVGFPEHIFSDIGSIGDFAASAEFAFGTVMQRTYAALGGRMHYGHPDMMAKMFMMQQGGVSKATRTVNLSEDIFAGMDFTLRGNGRRIIHREYFHVSKGRDMGFATVLAFFMKLSSGCGEVVLTRQSLRLGQVLGLPEFLTFYYAHVGYYLGQYCISRLPVMLTYLWVFALVNGAEDNFKAMDLRIGTTVEGTTNAEIIAGMLSSTFSAVVLLYLLASQLPFLVEVCMQQGGLSALFRFLKAFVTLSWTFFIFQAKVIGIYITNELQSGGAAYIATGRGLPTQRRQFMKAEEKPDRTYKYDGLYFDFVKIAFYDGARLLMAFICASVLSGPIQGLGWWQVMAGITIVSWLFAPFLFNPYQFAHQYFLQDLRYVKEFFLDKGGSIWSQWYEETTLKYKIKALGGESKGVGFRVTVFDVIYWLLFIGAWYSAVESKLHTYSTIFDDKVWRVLPRLPPCMLSLLACVVLTVVEPYLGRKQSTNAIRSAAAPSLHLAQVAALIIFLDICEIAVCVSTFLMLQWGKTTIAILVLKYSYLSMMLTAAEVILKLRWFPSWIRAFLRLFVYSHRMAQDVMVSGFIFICLSPVVGFDAVRSRLCSFSLHNLLVFRDVGQGHRIAEETRRQERGARAASDLSGSRGCSDSFVDSFLPPLGSGPAPPTRTQEMATPLLPDSGPPSRPVRGTPNGPVTGSIGAGKVGSTKAPPASAAKPGDAAAGGDPNAPGGGRIRAAAPPPTATPPPPTHTIPTATPPPAATPPLVPVGTQPPIDEEDEMEAELSAMRSGK
eukprot:TRINITY_DN45873_c0_g1_i1.p1 TRINITY_DN45873_c0_g1~~TRINITY_DN45873_c0_g1_i1.p1  ORF type:complete len:2183 (-),score=378.87 TRINITY_DN45873_c0_g1_i1:228-6776(-)